MTTSNTFKLHLNEVNRNMYALERQVKKKQKTKNKTMAKVSFQTNHASAEKGNYIIFSELKLSKNKNK